MNCGGGLPSPDDLGHLVSAKHSDGLLEFFDTGFESIYLFMQLLCIAEDETLQTFRRFEEGDSLSTHRVPLPALSCPSGHIDSQPRRVQALHGLEGGFRHDVRDDKVEHVQGFAALHSKVVNIEIRNACNDLVCLL